MTHLHERNVYFRDHCAVECKSFVLRLIYKPEPWSLMVFSCRIPATEQTNKSQHINVNFNLDLTLD